MPDVSNAQREWLKKLATLAGGPQLAERSATRSDSPPDPLVASPREAAEPYDASHGSNANVAPAEDDSLPAVKFERSISAVDDDDGRISAEVEYAKLPSALQAKLSQEFWAGLGMRQRRTLVETYGRLKHYGAWEYIKRVTGEKESPEQNVRLFGFEFETDGNSGGLTYQASDADGLIKKLKASGHFGEHGKLMGFMHAGQRSNREWSNEPGDPRGAHISAGADNEVDAHIDKQSPVGKPSDGNTSVDPRQAWKHGLQELVPEAVRKLALGIPIKPKGSLEENRDGWHGAEVTVGLEIELRGPVKKEKPKLRGSPTSADPAPKTCRRESRGAWKARRASSRSQSV